MQKLQNKFSIFLSASLKAGKSQFSTVKACLYPTLNRPTDSLTNRLTELGFTMIELLVVIAVIGVLAVAVLSSINPIEQINKGRDTRFRSDSEQLINAADRYFAIHEEYPWDTENGTTPAAAYTHNNGNGEWGWLQLLVDTAEVKTGFTNRVQNDDLIRVFKEADENGTMYACYLPSSRAFKLEAMNNCADGTTPDRGDPEVPAQAIDPCEDDTDIDADNYMCLP